MTSQPQGLLLSDQNVGSAKFSRSLVNWPHTHSVRSNYTLPDESGRQIEYLLIEEFIFKYRDPAVRELRIVEIQDAQ